MNGMKRKIAVADDLVNLSYNAAVDGSPQHNTAAGAFPDYRQLHGAAISDSCKLSG
jgi:hypothetical protein